MKSIFKKMLAVGVCAFFGHALTAQTLELTVTTGGNAPTGGGNGVSTTPIVVPFKSDILNNVTVPQPANTIDPTYAGGLTATFSFQNQQFTGLNYGSAVNGNQQTTGLVFGASPALATSPVSDGAVPNNRFTTITSYEGVSSYAPSVNMFSTDPFANPGVGYVSTGSGNAANGAAKIFTTAQALYGSAVPQNARVYFGDLVISFNRPVKNPVISLAGLGGSYVYTILGGDVQNCGDYRGIYFSTELEMANTGLTSTVLSGNAFLQLNGNDIANSNHNRPNGGSTPVAGASVCTDQYGAASGSIRINGTVQTLVYRIYLQGGTPTGVTPSPTAWSVPAAVIQGANHAPFTGDIWAVSTSLLKPGAQISGHIYNDADGLTNNDVNTTGANKNAGTNAGGLYANLMSGNLLVATVPVGSDGAYLFDSAVVAGVKVPVPAGTYTVRISTNTGAVGSNPANALPTGWVNTGEHNGADAGSDGTVNGISTAFAFDANNDVTEINFGIERTPVAVNLFKDLGPTPAFNQEFILNNVGAIPCPILRGSDPEDMPTENVLTTKTIRITSIPAITSLYYNDKKITLTGITDTTIVNFNPSLLKVKFNIPTIQQGDVFTYKYVDAAGFASPNATYRLQWIQGTLAVKFTSFDAAKVDCSANLKWITETEISTSRFDIQVSTGGDFKTVASVQATPGQRSYAYRYGMTTGVVNQFRIVAISNDGNITESQVRKLSCDGKGEIVIAPNPVYAQFTISGMSLGKNTVSVFSAEGKQVKTQMISGTTGSVNISNVPAGIYIVRVVDENNSVYTDKIIKK